MESKTLIQLLMTKLLTSHPNAEYLDLSGVSEADQLGATKTISKKVQRKSPKKCSNVLNVPKGLKTDESDGDFNIDDQYQELPSRKEIENIDLLKGIISTFISVLIFLRRVAVGERNKKNFRKFSLLFSTKRFQNPNSATATSLNPYP